MDTGSLVDTTFDFRTDTPDGKDPDTWSPTLCRYHKLLWSKPLPSGEVFALSFGEAPYYLQHTSDLGEFWLSSDSVVPSFRWNYGIRQEVPSKEIDDFRTMTYTIGGMMVFPAGQIQKKWTINQARGCLKKIGDRFDLTLECIRRHYAGDESPMSGVLARYEEFFGLFRNFHGYVQFFLLEDLVNADCSEVRFSTPFDDFRSSPIPDSLSAYRAYRDASVAFIEARNRRIQDWADEHIVACK